MSKKKQALQLVDAPIYSYRQAFYLSFYSSRLYIDVAKRWKGLGIIYLLLIIMLGAIPLSTRIIINFNKYFDEQLILPLKKIPPLYLQNKEISFDKPMPYLIKNSKGEVVTIIDTTGTVTNMTKAYPQLTVLITKDKLFFRPPKLELFRNSAAITEEPPYEYGLTQGSGEVFIGSEWVQTSGILKLKWLSEFLVYPMMVMFFLGLSIVLMFMLAFLGQLLAHLFFNLKLKFKQASRLLAISVTPAMACFFILLTANVVLPGLGIFYIALIAIYFCYSLVCLKREHAQLVHL